VIFCKLSIEIYASIGSEPAADRPSEELQEQGNDSNDQSNAATGMYEIFSVKLEFPNV